MTQKKCWRLGRKKWTFWEKSRKRLKFIKCTRITYRKNHPFMPVWYNVTNQHQHAQKNVSFHKTMLWRATLFFLHLRYNVLIMTAYYTYKHLMSECFENDWVVDVVIRCKKVSEKFTSWCIGIFPGNSVLWTPRQLTKMWKSMLRSKYMNSLIKQKKNLRSRSRSSNSLIRSQRWYHVLRCDFSLNRKSCRSRLITQRF